MMREELATAIEEYAPERKLSVEKAEECIVSSAGVELTKLLDEYNYLKYTRKELGEEAGSTSEKAGKIKRIVEIIDEIVRGAYEASRVDWVVRTSRSSMVKASADKLKRVVEEYARRGDLEGMIKYLQNAMNDPTGREVCKILRACGKKSLEDVYWKILKIARDI